MVQEVQTWVGITNETTLETIEAIGTSSFKIVEGRQTKGGRYASGCVASGNVYWTYKSPWSRDSGVLKSTDTTISSSYGKQDFTISNWGIRVPMHGTYSIDLTRWGAASGVYDATIFLKISGETIYTKKFTRAQTETVNLIRDLGKFDTIEIWGQFYYNSSNTTFNAYFSTIPTLTIKQL